MNLNIITRVSIGLVVLLPALTACKGRTVENMEPTGDTVEVVIAPKAQVITDTINSEFNQNVDIE